MGTNRTDKESSDMPVTEEDMRKEGSVSKPPSNVVYLKICNPQNPEPISVRPNEGLDDLILHIRDGLSARCKKCSDQLTESEKSLERSMIAILIQMGILNSEHEDIIYSAGRTLVKINEDRTLPLDQFYKSKIGR